MESFSFAACSAHQVETIALILLEFGARPCIESKERESFAERLEKVQPKLISKEKKSEVLRKINEFVGERHFEIECCLFVLLNKLCFLHVMGWKKHVNFECFFSF